MDINDFRGLLTAVIFIAFIAIGAWAFSRGAKERFERSAQIPFDDESKIEENK